MPMCLGKNSSLEWDSGWTVSCMNESVEVTHLRDQATLALKDDVADLIGFFFDTDRHSLSLKFFGQFGNARRILPDPIFANNRKCKVTALPEIRDLRPRIV